MFRSSVVSWLTAALLLSPSKAQDVVTSFVSVETSTPTPPQANTYTVAVGRGNHQFSPEVVQAAVGDVIEFQFFPPNHSVVRADYLMPCIPYEMTGPRVGFFSGFYPVDAILQNPPTWTVQVNDTDPIFYYCSAPGSCLDWAMVGVINPNATTSLETQKQLALNSSFMLQPGEAWPAEATESAPADYPATSTAGVAPSTAVDSPAATSSAATVPSSSSNALSTGAIAGIAIGGAAVLLIAGFLVWYCGRQSRQNQPTQEAPPGYVPPTYGNYGPPMSPSAKHVSGITVSSAHPSPGFQGYPSPYSDQTQGHMAPFGASQTTSPHLGPQPPFHPHHPQMSHHSAAFGIPQMTETPVHANVAVEADSDRGGSPPPLQQQTGQSGIEAFLARQGRMSPSNTNTNTTNTNTGGSDVGEGTGPAIRGHFGTGPYEMSAGGTGSWMQR